MAWDGPSCVIGIFIGLSIMLILTWIGYSTRTFIYADVPLSYPECRFVNYFNNPGNAIANGANADEILSVNSSNEMRYQRVPKDVCVPGSNQDVRIINPQYCLFVQDDGTSIEAKNTFYDSPYYISTSDINGKKLDIISLPNCNPASNNQGLNLVSGSPEIKWDPIAN